MRILLWHGYLLGGTGSNVYTRALARAWQHLGHEVVVVCQEPHPERFDLGGATVIRPEIGPVLPVFVLDRYEGVEARRLGDTSPRERQRVIDANVAALRDQLPAGFVLTNHLLLGGPVGDALGEPYTVKAHGSELEFAMRGNPELVGWARDTLGSAHQILAGTEHIRNVIADVVGPGPHLDRVRIVPPGVDVDEFRPAPRADAIAALIEQSRQDPPNPANANERLPDEGNAERLQSFLQQDGPLVLFVGKLSEEKGVHLLVEALRQLAGRGVGPRAVIVGFGPARPELERLADGLDVLFTGALEHRHLAHLFALADVAVTPSVFPEAFGMVAAEAAACGAPPLVARHSGLAEVAEGLEAEYPDDLRSLTSFANGDAAELGEKLGAILALPRDRHAELCEAARRAAVGRWSWEGVARAILAGP